MNKNKSGELNEYIRKNLFKNTAKISTQIALAVGSLLSDERRHFHYKVAIRQAYKLVEANSLGSTIEVQAWLDIMRIKKYITEEEHSLLNFMLEEIKKLIIIAYIKMAAVA